MTTVQTDSESDRDEGTALHDIHDPNDMTVHPKPAPTPLPKFQLFMALLIQFAEPITSTVIYPFINQFVRDTGVTNGDERKTGYYAGIIESTFFFTEALTVFQWGWLSDRIGRRPVLLLGPLGLSFAMLGFGLSTTFWPLVIYRCFQGIFNGNIGVSKSVMAEITDSTNIGDAYALMPLVWSFGTTIGPMMGGVLTSPAETWPETLGRIDFLKTHPYFLPCFVSALLAFMTFAISFLGLKETLPSAIAKQTLKERRNDYTQATVLEASLTSSLISHGDPHEYGSHMSADSDDSIALQKAKERPPPLRELLSRDMILTYINYAFLAFSDMSYQVLLPLMFSTSVHLGGLGLTPYTIGTIMGTWGFFNAIVQVNFLGKMLRKLGARKLYMISYACFLCSIGAYPISSYFAKRAGGPDAKVWSVIFVQLLFQMMIYMAYGSIQVLLVEITPSKAFLGSMNGIAQMISSGTRSIAPSIASSLFSISLERHLAGGNMVYFILLTVTLVGIRLSFFLPKC